jgi:hypothetical protein
MYENTGTGFKKVGHERMLNDKGRKVVRENLGGSQGAHNSYDYYKGMH